VSKPGHFGKQKYLRSFEMWYWRRMQKINWSDCVTDEILQIPGGDTNILQINKEKEG
jgi:hypothetical protein